MLSQCSARLGKMVIASLFTLGFGLMLSPQPVSAQVPVHSFNLSAGVSDIYWPFADSSFAAPGKWKLNGGNNHGQGDHLGSDYYAEDWNLPGNTDCGVPFYAPFSGTVLFAGHIDIRRGYGEQVVIQSDVDPTFAFRIGHLSAYSITYTQNHKVVMGDMIGRVGTTGNSNGCHAHVVLYKNLDNAAIESLQKGQAPKSQTYAAEMKFDANYIATCPDNQFRAEYFPNVDLYGDPDFSGCTRRIDYNWGAKPIGPLKQKDNVSVRWQGNIGFAAGSYIFSTASDDGIRFSIDGQSQINAWSIFPSPRLYTTSPLVLTNANHQVKLEYLATKGNAQVALQWQELNAPNHAPEIVPIPNQTIEQGGSFQRFDLDEFGSDPDYGDTITWSASGNSLLSVNISPQNGVVITAPRNITASENITFTATDSHGATASRTATYTIVPKGGCTATIAAGDVGGLVLAIDAANSNPDTTTICLSAGAPYEFGTVHNQTYGQTGLPVIGTPIVIKGNGAVIQRNMVANVGMRYFAINSNGNLTLQDMSLINGVDISDTYGGGAILNEGGNVTLNNITFTDNKAFIKGGGAVQNENNGVMSISNSHFTNNRAEGQGSGGGISNRNPSDTLTVSNSTFDGNYGDNNAGAIYNQGTVTLNNNVFTANTSNNHGGAIFQYSGTTTVTGGKFEGNQVLQAFYPYGYGGAIYNNFGGILNISQVYFKNNSSTVDGGAIYTGTTATANSSCFVGNNHNAVVGLNGGDFTSNWWGSSTGPSSGGPGTGDGVVGVTFNPWLTSKPAYCL